MRKEDEEFIQDEIEKSTLEPVALDIQQTEEPVSERKSEDDSETNSELEQEVTESLESALETQE
jgi:hypothetical protein